MASVLAPQRALSGGTVGKESNPIKLALDRFQSVPVLDFDEVTAGSCASRTLLLDNPTASTMNLTIDLAPEIAVETSVKYVVLARLVGGVGRENPCERYRAPCV
jgi:hypothetical protein